MSSDIQKINFILINWMNNTFVHFPTLENCIYQRIGMFLQWVCNYILFTNLQKYSSQMQISLIISIFIISILIFVWCGTHQAHQA